MQREGLCNGAEGFGQLEFEQLTLRVDLGRQLAQVCRGGEVWGSVGKCGGVWAQTLMPDHPIVLPPLRHRLYFPSASHPTPIILPPATGLSEIPSSPAAPGCGASMTNRFVAIPSSTL